MALLEWETFAAVELVVSLVYGENAVVLYLQLAQISSEVDRFQASNDSIHAPAQL